MKLQQCPECGAALRKGKTASSCPACSADWSYPGFPDRCPACDADMGGSCTHCPHCQADMLESAREVAEYRRELRKTLSRKRWRNRLIFWSAAIGIPILARLLGQW